MSVGPSRHRAFTIIELVVAMVIMSVIAGVITPVIVSATDHYAASRDLRTTVDDGGFAIDAMVRIIRETPAHPSGGLGLMTADARSFVTSDGRGFAINETTLELITPDAVAPLARDVRSLEIIYILDDGVTLAPSPAQAHRVHVTADIGGLRLSAVAFPRVRIGGGL